MTPTSLRLLATLGLVSAVAGWVIADLVDRFAGRGMPVPWTAPATLGILALALVFWAMGMRRRLRDGHVDPFVAARTAALAMAASRTGAIATGVYPGKHGIMDNTIFIPEADPDRVISTADYEKLQAADAATGGKLMGVPSMGEILEGAGKNLLVPKPKPEDKSVQRPGQRQRKPLPAARKRKP